MPKENKEVPELKMDNSHVSSNWEKGQHDTPITQKGKFDDQKIRLDTPVDGLGNVGPSDFG
jgi:hypothetical protein